MSPILHGKWRVAVVAWLALALLAACSPPPELLGRPTTPADVSAHALMPPGRLEQIATAGAVDSASVQAAGGGRFAAFRFDAAETARRAFVGWRNRRLSQADVQSSQSVDVGALQFARYSGAGVHGLAWVSGTWLFTAEAADRSALEALIAASGAGGAGLAGWAGSLVPLALVMVVMAVAIALATLLLIRRILRRLWVLPSAGVSAIDRAALTQRLLALNAPDRPWLVRHDDRADLVVEWKFADATWWGVLAKSGLRKAYRLRLYLDEPGHRCRALDEFGEVDWTAGALGSPRVTFQKISFRGVQLVARERGIGYGFKTSTGGGAGKVLDYSFDIDSLKQPVIEAVTTGGWIYQPILWPKRRTN